MSLRTEEARDVFIIREKRNRTQQFLIGFDEEGGLCGVRIY